MTILHSWAVDGFSYFSLISVDGFSYFSLISVDGFSYFSLISVILFSLILLLICFARMNFSEQYHTEGKAG